DTIKQLGEAMLKLCNSSRRDSQVITISSSSIPAIKQILDYLRKGRLLILVVYPGHEGGDTEKNDILAFTKQLDQKQYSVATYQFINQRNCPPFVIAIEKR